MERTVGKPVDRVDGTLKVTGAATYSGDYDPARYIHAVLILSTIASGRIRQINTVAAEKASGVVKVITHINAMQLHFSNSADAGSGKYAEKDLLPLQSDRIFYDGQVIGVVVAITLEQAQYAATLISFDYDQAPSVFNFAKNFATAYQPQQGLAGAEPTEKRGNLEEALASAAVKFEETYTTPVYHHNAMEPHSTAAEWNGDELLLYDATQTVMGCQALVAILFGLQTEKIRVISSFIGGGFGSKGFIWPGTVLAAMAAKMAGRPVKLVLSRQQAFTTAGRRSETEQKISLGADLDGKLTAIQHLSTSETSFVDEFIEQATIATPMLYSVPNLHTRHTIVRLNRGTPCPTRAPGESVGTFALEVAMDELAIKLNIDPVQFRLINYAEMDEQKNKQFSGKNLRECYQRGADAIGWPNRQTKPGMLIENGLLIGYGMATATYPAYRNPSTAKAILHDNGIAEILCATQDIGTGTYTVMTQIAADALGLAIDKVKVKLGDTSFPKGALSGGSQVSASVGPAIRAASLGVIAKLKKLAVSNSGSPFYGVPEDDLTAGDGRLILKNQEAGETYTEILQSAGLQKIEALAKTNVSTTQGPKPKPAPTGSPEAIAEKESAINPAVKKDEDTDRNPYSFHSFGAHFVKVVVDPLLGTVRVDKAVSVIDVGTVLNLKTAKNQIMGGMIFGMGMALMEETVYDPNDGRIVKKDLAGYLVPVHADMPEFDIQFINKPDYYISPIGARGAGEIGVTGIVAAISNAVFNATGKRIRNLPITPEKLI